MQDIIIYNTTDGRSSVALYAKDGNIWLNQSQIADLFATSKSNISLHISNILKDNELDKNSVVKYYLTTASDGKEYNVEHYSLPMIIAIGYRVRGVRGTQFRKWTTEHLSEYLIKGFTMDDERLKNPDGRADYFDELLLRIRDIRASEKRFYKAVIPYIHFVHFYNSFSFHPLQFALIYHRVKNFVLLLYRGLLKARGNRLPGAMTKFRINYLYEDL